MEQLSFDIIIPVYRPEKEFGKMLDMLGRQRCAAGKLILMNTEKTLWEKADFDKSPVEQGMLPNGTKIELHHISKKEFDHGRTRAEAAARSRADILLFMTQDAMPQDGYLTEHLLKVWKEENGTGRIAAAYARQLPKEDCHFLERYTRQFNYGEKSMVKSAEDITRLGIKTYFCSNVCAAYRRDIYEELGGFEKQAIFNEDMIFAAKLINAGYGVAYVSDAEVLHSHNYSGMQQLRRNFDLAVSQADHPEIFEKVPSEKEGIRLVCHTAGYLLCHGKLFLIPKLIWQSGCKYLGYRLGKRYRSLPAFVISFCTMNREYWKNKVF